MFWKKCRKPAALTSALFLAICITGHAQTEKLAISRFQVLNDFYSNASLLGYWERPAFGLVYEGALRKQQLPKNDVGAFYNQALGSYGAGIELHRGKEWFKNITSVKAGVSRGFDLSSTTKLSVGTAVKYTYLSYEFDDFTFPDQVEPFYGFVKATEETPYVSTRSVITADFGISLHSEKYLFAVNGENIAPILAKRNDENAEYFNSRSHLYTPAMLQALFVYQFNLGRHFFLSPGAKINYEIPAPEPWIYGLVNFQWRSIAMINYSYEVHGFHQIMVGGRIKDKVSLSIGATTYAGEYSPFYSDRINFNLSVLTQL